jgi:hypothetical protein
MTNEADEQLAADWTHLPNGTETVNLWDCLHDGSLVHIASDLMERTVLLRFDVDYVRDFNKLPKGLTFEFLLLGVQSVRSLRCSRWPGPCEVHAGMPKEEQSRRVAEYQAKWREESDDWNTFETAANNADSPEVLDATLVQGGRGTTLRLGLLMADDSYRNVFLRADSLGIRTSDGRQFTVAEYLALGEAYWKAFAERKRANRE